MNKDLDANKFPLVRASADKDGPIPDAPEEPMLEVVFVFTDGSRFPMPMTLSELTAKAKPWTPTSLITMNLADGEVSYPYHALLRIERRPLVLVTIATETAAPPAEKTRKRSGRKPKA